MGSITFNTYNYCKLFAGGGSEGDFVACMLLHIWIIESFIFGKSLQVIFVTNFCENPFLKNCIGQFLAWAHRVPWGEAYFGFLSWSPFPSTFALP